MAQVGEMLGGTLAMFACVTDPEAIVIGGALYLFMENKPFLLSANPFLLMLPVVFFNAETGKAQSES